MQLVSLSKLYTLLLVIGAVTLVVEAGPTPKKPATPAPAVNANKSPTKTTKPGPNRVCHPLPNSFSKYKPAKGKGTGKGTDRGTGRSAAAPPVTPKTTKIKRSDIERSELIARAYTPKAATGKVRLFHGTEDDFTQVKINTQGGDFGGPAFYMTDRKRAALQFACLHNSVPFIEDEAERKATKMWVNEYEWDGTGATIHTFTGIDDPDWKGYQKWAESCKNPTPNEKFQAIFNSDMIVGPMRGDMDISRGMTANFWQNVVMGQPAVDKHLKYIDRTELLCEPEGMPGNFD